MKIYETSHYTFRRLIAYIIDWYLGSIVSMLPFLIISLAKHIDYNNIMNLELYSNQDLCIGMFFSLLFSLIYFLVIPFKLYDGQTIGKKIMKLKIIMNSNQEMKILNLFLRQILFIWFVEMSLHSIGGIFNQGIFILLKFNIILFFKEMNFYVIAISVFMLLVSNNHITLHDLISNTKVIDLRYK
ncbi:RDD family protein [Candidatus Stoquefichus massiliensis]|uniref:RDD family protein n=1 Tax=Candidatus Stoquefichus massiliensis TaxID=1470350 RepID=UPI000484B6AA|nr:RDD family protein [Candidatus Stoquefichus massiliensis]